MLGKALQDDRCKLKALRLLNYGYMNNHMDCLFTALRSGKCNLESLDISGTQFSVDDMNKLNRTLGHKNCRLKSLKVSTSGYINDKLIDRLLTTLTTRKHGLELLTVKGVESSGTRESITRILKENAPPELLIIDLECVNMSQNYPIDMVYRFVWMDTNFIFLDLRRYSHDILNTASFLRRVVRNVKAKKSIAIERLKYDVVEKIDYSWGLISRLDKESLNEVLDKIGNTEMILDELRKLAGEEQFMMVVLM